MTLSSAGVHTHNINEKVAKRQITNDELVDWAMYQLKLSSWWTREYNRAQPAEVIDFSQSLPFSVTVA